MPPRAAGVLPVGRGDGHGDVGVSHDDVLRGSRVVAGGESGGGRGGHPGGEICWRGAWGGDGRLRGVGGGARALEQSGWQLALLDVLDAVLQTFDVADLWMENNDMSLFCSLRCIN